MKAKEQVITPKAYSSIPKDVNYIINYIYKRINEILVANPLDHSYQSYQPVEATHKVLRSLYIKKDVWDRVKEVAETKDLSASQLTENILAEAVYTPNIQPLLDAQNELETLGCMLQEISNGLKNHPQWEALYKLQAELAKHGSDFVKRINQLQEAARCSQKF